MTKHTRYYTPRAEPPDFLDRLLSHPLEFCLAVLWLAIGSLSLAAGVDLFYANRMLEAAPWWSGLLLAALFFLGAGGVLHGLLVDARTLNEDWFRERLGLALGALGMLGYALSVLMAYPMSITGWVTPTILAGGCGLRIWATFREEKSRRQVVEQWRNQNGGQA